MSVPFSLELLHKTEEICALPASAPPLPRKAGDVAGFAGAWQEEIAKRVARLGFRFRRATLDDLDSIAELHRTCFPQFTADQRPSELSFYRLLTFGESIAVEDARRRLVGFNLQMLVANAELMLLCCGIAIHPSVTSRGLGRHLGRYGSLAAMAAGAMVRRGTLQVSNDPSLALFLNRMGAICDRYHPRLGGEGRFEYALPLTPAALRRNTVDVERLGSFVAVAEEGSDYRLLKATAGGELERLYRASSFRVAAFAPRGLVAEEPRLVALPPERLGPVPEAGKAAAT